MCDSFSVLSVSALFRACVLSEVEILRPDTPPTPFDPCFDRDPACAGALRLRPVPASLASRARHLPLAAV
jgi:hypothetical protein